MAIALYLILSVAIFFGNNLSINTLKYVPLTKFQNGSCPSWKKIREIVEPAIRNTLNSNDDEWRPVISLNMRDPLQNCPSGWSLYNTPFRSRSCGQTSAPGCSVATWTVNHSYSRVRGRALGYAKGNNDAFMGWTSHRDAALNYADGMNIFLATASPQHVWTFAVDHPYGGPPRCPCTKDSYAFVPHFVGSHYFCDRNRITNTGLWDGVGCAASTCCDFNNPPWFSVSFNTTYTQDIEVRICTDEKSSNEKVSLIELEVYVQ